MKPVKKGENGSALLLIDVINTFDFPGARKLAKQADAMASRLKALVESARSNSIPVIYVNDNFGKWRSDFHQTVAHCLSAKCLGKRLAQSLRPGSEDYGILKPRNSGFFQTPLDLLLQTLGVKHLVLTGLALNNCVLFTANDAHMRGYKIIVPKDCVASFNADEAKFVLAQMKSCFQAKLVNSRRMRWK